MNTARVEASISNATVIGDGDLTLNAVSTAKITSTLGNEATSSSAALYGATTSSFGAMLTSNMVNSSAKAFILNGSATVGSASISASDDAAIDAHSELQSTAESSNDAGKGLLNNFANALINDYKFTSSSGVTNTTQSLKFGDKVWHDGTVYQFMGADTRS